MIQTLSEPLGNTLNLDMVRVEGGTFEMGGTNYSFERPIHKVHLDTFYIGKYPVTQAQWQAVMGTKPSYFQGADRPVEQVSWEDTQEFIQKLSTLRGRVYRLPTEAEWEYAARGGNKSKGYIYAGSNDLGDVGWYRENSHRETKDVGLKFPNELGLYDMSGNVEEWCHDWYSNGYYQECASQGIVRNPTGPSDGSGRVLRGGGWADPPRYCHVAYRNGSLPEYRLSHVGFRLAFSLQSAG